MATGKGNTGMKKFLPGVGKLFTVQEDEMGDFYTALRNGISGDLVVSASPATLSNSAAAINTAIGAGGFSRNVAFRFIDSLNNLHSWFNGTFAVAVTKSSAGTATIRGGLTNAAFAGGTASITIDYAGTWSGGTLQLETATVVGTVSTAGNAAIIVTAANLTGSPKTYNVPVALNDTAAQVATKVKAFLATDTVLTAIFTVGGTGATVTLTTVAPALANDATLNINIGNGTAAGLTAAPTSVHTTPGVAADTVTLTLTGGTKLGYTVANKTSVDTLLA